MLTIPFACFHSILPNRDGIQRPNAARIIPLSQDPA